MRNNIFGCLLVFFFGLVLLNGCAKDQIVKQDDSITPAKDTTAASQPPVVQQPPATQALPGTTLKSEPIQSQQVTEDTSANLALPRQASDSASTKGSSSSITAEAAQLALKRINFEFDSYALSQVSRDTLYTNAELLLKKYRGPIRLEGNCDERGSDEYNLALGENRAKSALNYLVTLGVPSSQLSIISYGKERPLDPAHTEEAWAINRRVDFTVIK